MSETQQNVQAEMDYFFGHLYKLQDRIDISIKEQNKHTIEVLSLCCEDERAQLLTTLNGQTCKTIDNMFISFKQVALAAIDMKRQ